VSGVDRFVATQDHPLCGGRRERALAVLAVAEPEFRRTARRVSLCTDDAEDAFQRAVEILLTKAPDRPPNALVAWMHVVTRREALAVRRARERILAAWREDGNELFEDLLCERPGPVERVERRDSVAAAAEALAELKPDERVAIVLQAQGYSYAEIGELRGWTYTKVWDPVRHGVPIPPLQVGLRSGLGLGKGRR